MISVQHLASKKHEDKLRGANRPNNPMWRGRGGRGGYEGRGGRGGYEGRGGRGGGGSWQDYNSRRGAAGDGTTGSSNSWNSERVTAVGRGPGRGARRAGGRGSFDDRRDNKEFTARRGISKGPYNQRGWTDYGSSSTSDATFSRDQQFQSGSSWYYDNQAPETSGDYASGFSSWEEPVSTPETGAYAARGREREAGGGGGIRGERYGDTYGRAGDSRYSAADSGDAYTGEYGGGYDDSYNGAPAMAAASRYPPRSAPHAAQQYGGEQGYGRPSAAYDAGDYYGGAGYSGARDIAARGGVKRQLGGDVPPSAANDVSCHIAKFSNPPPPPPPVSEGSGAANGQYYGDGGHYPPSYTYTDPLSQNFVHGNAMI